jgi:hypothetical protein
MASRTQRVVLIINTVLQMEEVNITMDLGETIWGDMEWIDLA